MTTKQLLAGLVVPEGRVALIIAPFVWGKGKTFDEAYDNAVKSRGRRTALPLPIVAQHAHPDVAITTDGFIEYPSDAPEPVDVGKWR